MEDVPTQKAEFALQIEWREDLPTDDAQYVPNARSDSIELEASRRLYGFSPWVGQPATSTVEVQVGRVRVVIT